MLGYEGLGGQVQTIYMDPPYAVKFGSNFQPFVRKRDVTHGDDEDMVREPEMVQAYRDTWELGLHSFLTYLRDRLLLGAGAATPLREHLRADVGHQPAPRPRGDGRGVRTRVLRLADQLSRLPRGFRTKTLATLGDFLLWYARDPERLKVRKIFEEQPVVLGEGNARWVLLPDGNYRGVTAVGETRGNTAAQETLVSTIPGDLQSQGASREQQPFEFEGKTYRPNPNSHWKPNYPDGLERLVAEDRIHVAANSLRFRRFASDFPLQGKGQPLDRYPDRQLHGGEDLRCADEPQGHRTLPPHDLRSGRPRLRSYLRFRHDGVLRGEVGTPVDHHGHLARAARPRATTAAHKHLRLSTNSRSRNAVPQVASSIGAGRTAKGEEVGGIVPHITLESIANDEPAKEEVLVDRPETDDGITRVSGPFCVEATIPTPMDWEDGEGDSSDEGGWTGYADHVERMIEVLRRSPILRLAGGNMVALSKVRPPARTMSLSAEALVEGDSPKTAAIVFGPENGAVAERLVFEAAREAYGKSYGHLYVIGFAIQPDARRLVEDCEQAVGVPATYVQASMDLVMGDLLKNLRSSQIFSVCGLPDVRIKERLPRTDIKSSSSVSTCSNPWEWTRIISSGKRRARLVPRHGLQWTLLPCVPGVLSTYFGVGGPQAFTPGRFRGQRLAASFRDGQRPFPGR